MAILKSDNSYNMNKPEHSIGASGTEKMSDEDIIKAFGELIQAKDESGKEEFMNIIAKLENYTNCNEKLLIKMFVLNMKSGIMRNTDDAPNISFRVETINNIFDSIIESFEERGINGQEAGEIFYRAGYKCGKSFGQVFIDDYRSNCDEIEESEVIQKWCDFDSSVGWGRLEYSIGENTISITNNFETQRKKDRNFPRDCEFFKGYITGVLSEILQEDSVELACISCDICPKKSLKQKCVYRICYGV